jgi:hypothetical protein
MRNIKESINALDWEAITKDLHDKGFVIVRELLTPLDDRRSEDYRPARIGF